MYQNHSLRANLQEWKNRLFKSGYVQADMNLKFFMSKVLKTNKFSSVIKHLNQKYSFNDGEIEYIIHTIAVRINRGRKQYDFRNEEHYIAFLFSLLSYVEKKEQLENFAERLSGKYANEAITFFFDSYVEPFINYLHDVLDEDNNTLYLLEKYKKKVEWFTRDELVLKYSNATKNYEQIFEDDLRLFLFEQGVDYPFSTPSSPSGRADVVGNIDTEDPLIIEVKIFDSKKNYKADRVKGGFNQIVKYTNDYNKNFGYLVVFNLDAIEITIQTNTEQTSFPPCIELNNKHYYIIIINLNYEESASKSKLKPFIITENELVKIN